MAKETKKKSQISNKKEGLIGKSSSVEGYILQMNNAPHLGQSSSWLALIPAIIFAAITILIVRASSYVRNMEQFFWTNDNNELIDFFSRGKMFVILACAVIALFVLLCRFVDKKMFIRKEYMYIPMAIYGIFVIVSYIFSEHKEFSLLGYNDRFEGTLVILAYLVMLFYIINTVNSESNVKVMLVAIGISCGALGLLGLTQGTGHDFFRTTLGKKLITPMSSWENLDLLNFTFENNEIYQTVYNINYVSFYLALVIPIFAMIMIYTINNKSDKWIAKSVTMVALFALLVYNLVGSMSAGGMAGLAVAFILALVLFNKRLLKWWKAVLVMLLVMVIIFGLTHNLWMSELGATASGLGGNKTNETVAAEEKTYIDYMITEGNILKYSVDGNEFSMTAQVDSASGEFTGLDIRDAENSMLETYSTEGENIVYHFEDERFADKVSFYLAQDENGLLYIVLQTDNQEWRYVVTIDGIFYVNEIGNIVEMEKVPSIGFKNHQTFGSYRGYIWSRTLAMLGDNILIGDGADTYCLEYPHNDYAGRYNIDWDINIIVDKPHNMYMGMFQGTGGVSMVAFIAIIMMYMIQSIKVLKNNKYKSWCDYAVAGIFLGVVGFAVAGIFNDSSVSVMPMFYSLLGTGIVLNRIVVSSKTEVS